MGKRTDYTITNDRVEEILKDSVFSVDTVFNKCTVVACKLPNGFVIVESSACVDPANYDEDMGVDICLKAIKRKIWELEGYSLQDAVGDLDDDSYDDDLDDDESECDGDCKNCDLFDDDNDDEDAYWDEVMKAYNTYLDYFDHYLDKYAKNHREFNRRHGIH